MIMLYFCNHFSISINNIIATHGAVLEASAVLKNTSFFPLMIKS